MDKPILVSDDEERWHKRYFSCLAKGIVYVFDHGRTQWNQSGVVGYKYAKPAEENE